MPLSFAVAVADDEAVDDGLDGVHLVAVELDLLVDVVDLAVDTDADEAQLAHIFEDLLVLALAVLDQGRQEQDAAAFRHLLDGLDDLAHGLLVDLAAAAGAVGDADAGVEEAQVVIDLGHGADGGAGVAAGAFLVDARWPG